MTVFHNTKQKKLKCCLVQLVIFRLTSFTSVWESSRPSRQGTSQIGAYAPSDMQKATLYWGIYLKYWFIFIIRREKGFLFRYPFLPLFSKLFDSNFLRDHREGWNVRVKSETIFNRFVIVLISVLCRKCGKFMFLLFKDIIRHAQMRR